MDRQPRAVYKILGRVEASAPLADVPVITQLQFQQSSVEYVEVPQTQFSDRVVDILVAPQRQVHSANCAEARCDRTGAVLGSVRDAPVVVQRQARMVQTVSVWRCRRCSTCAVVVTQRRAGVPG